MVDTKSFPRTGQAEATDLRSVLVGLIPGSLSIHTMDGSVEIRCEWGGVDEAAVAAAIATARDRDAVFADRRRVAFEADPAVTALIRWVGQLHGKTPQQARDEVWAIYQGL